MGSCMSSPEESERSSVNTVTPTSATSSRTATSSTIGLSSSTGVSLSSFYESAPEGQILPVPNLRIFTFTELKTATRGFRPDTLLGEGGFGRVFKGWLDEKTLSPAKAGNGIIVAVKKLKRACKDGKNGRKKATSLPHASTLCCIGEHMRCQPTSNLCLRCCTRYCQGGMEAATESEINFLGRLSHPNLVRLLGYCFDQNELLLVYEFMQRGSLENHLFRRSSAVEPISWRVRLKILIGAARGLAFLHTSHEKIIYRDFKASNILLDSNYNPKISDFGLAKNGPSGGLSHVTTSVIGTYGYAAPEYVATGHLYVKSDVYGFGVVLLEMMTGLRAMDSRRPTRQQNLVEWIKPLLNDRRRRVLQLMDQRLEGKFPKKGAIEASKLAVKCLEAEPKNRPHMKEVLETLERIEAIKDKARDEPKRPSSRSPMHQNNYHPHHLPRRSPLHPGMEGAGPGMPAYQRSPMKHSPHAR